MLRFVRRGGSLYVRERAASRQTNLSACGLPSVVGGAAAEPEQCPRRVAAYGHRPLGVTQQHARLVDRDRAPENAVPARAVPLVVRPLDELVRRRLVPERDRAL